MKHAGHAALAAAENMLCAIRKHESLTEKKYGVFYRRSEAFLHFHEAPAGLFADLKVSGAWRRFPVNTREEQQNFLAAVEAALA